jgi:hypothetical protein
MADSNVDAPYRHRASIGGDVFDLIEQRLDDRVLMHRVVSQ